MSWCIIPFNARHYQELFDSGKFGFPYFEWQRAMSAVLSVYLAAGFSESWTLMLVLEASKMKPLNGPTTYCNCMSTRPPGADLFYNTTPPPPPSCHPWWVESNTLYGGEGRAHWSDWQAMHVVADLIGRQEARI